MLIFYLTLESLVCVDLKKQLIALFCLKKISWEQDHVEGYLELSAKTKTYFATAVALWDADFYVKVDDDVHVNIGKDVIYLPTFTLAVVHVEV